MKPAAFEKATFFGHVETAGFHCKAAPPGHGAVLASTSAGRGCCRRASICGGCGLASFRARAPSGQERPDMGFLVELIREYGFGIVFLNG
jgi:hypothetical protein